MAFLKSRPVCPVQVIIKHAKLVHLQCTFVNKDSQIDPHGELNGVDCRTGAMFLHKRLYNIGKGIKLTKNSSTS